MTAAISNESQESYQIEFLFVFNLMDGGRDRD
ncbi:hypothetical protein X731_02095 [Mesorhizobium sp. L2C054A000]|nr:hypothetical protein X731_02095 [Mesorhizobium sp. L2C054A000]